MHKLSPKDIWAHFEPVIQNIPKKITIKKAKTQPIIFFQFFISTIAIYLLSNGSSSGD